MKVFRVFGFMKSAKVTGHEYVNHIRAFLKVRVVTEMSVARARRDKL